MKSRIVAILLALVVAVIGAIAVISYAHKADERAVAGQEIQEVYLADKDVPKGTSLSKAVDDELITRQSVVAKGVPDGALLDIADAGSASVALNTIVAGSMLLVADFGDAERLKTASLVPDGKVAITVGFSNTAAVQPFLRKGSRIAIYNTFNRRDPQINLPNGAHLNDDKASIRSTGVVLTDVEVVSVNVPKSGRGGTSSSASGGELLVTVVVSPEDATRLVQAIQTGNLYAALLGNGAKVPPGAVASDRDVVGR